MLSQITDTICGMMFLATIFKVGVPKVRDARIARITPRFVHGSQKAIPIHVVTLMAKIRFQNSSSD